MQYVIDGHNLIPHVHGLSLSDPEDEAALLGLLDRFQRAKRATITVFFDRAPLGKHGVKRHGSVRAVFVPIGKTADTAIMESLARNKATAKSITLVSSDRQVQAAGRERHATVISSSQFAQELETVLTEAAQASPDHAPETTNDVEEWLELFSKPRPKD